MQELKNFEVDGDMLTITCAKEDFGSINRKLNELGIEPAGSRVEANPK